MSIRQATIYVILIIAAIFVAISFFPKKKITNYPSTGTDIIAYGDSLVQGVGSSNYGDFVSVLSRKIGRPIINLGNSGDTTFDGLARIDDLDKYKPKIVILLLGGNDYLKKIPQQDTQANLIKIIKNIQDRGAIVLLLGVRGGLLSDRFETMYSDLSYKYNTGYVPDVLRGLVFNNNYMSDPIHPNNAGYLLITEKVYPKLKSLIK
jgi:acyl-CoA thioesterase-1